MEVIFNLDALVGTTQRLALHLLAQLHQVVAQLLAYIVVGQRVLHSHALAQLKCKALQDEFIILEAILRERAAVVLMTHEFIL